MPGLAGFSLIWRCAGCGASFEAASIPDARRLVYHHVYNEHKLAKSSELVVAVETALGRFINDYHREPRELTDLDRSLLRDLKVAWD